MISFITIAIWSIFILSFTTQLYFYLFIFKRLAFYTPANKPDFQPAVSVIICAKNEAHNLEKKLPKILEQDYSSFEVIVVNDGSTDGTESILTELCRKYKNVRVISILPEKSFGKKNALTQGIKASNHDYLLLTDADCIPQSKHWIKGMAKNFSNKNEIIFGYGAYEYRKGLLNQLIRFDTLYIAIQYLSFALSGKPYMGVGRNLAYKKSLFINNNGFDSHKNILSGDDDLFINEVANGGNTCIEISYDTHTVSSCKTSWKSWLYQKKRHLTTAVKYKPFHQFTLGLFQGSIIAFYASFAYLIMSMSVIWPIIILFLIRTFIQVFIFKACILKLKEKQHYLLFPVYELSILFLNLILVTWNLIYTHNSWQKN